MGICLVSAPLQDYQAACNNTAIDSDQEPLTSRDRTAIISLATILKQDPSTEMQQRTVAFLVHLAILKHCALSNRPTEPYFCPTLEAANLDSRFINLFCEVSTLVLKAHESGGDPGSEEAWDTYDLMDGRLWASVLKASPKAILPASVVASYKGLAARVSNISGIMLLTRAEVVNPSTSWATNSTDGACRTSTSPSDALLPFSQPDFEPLLKGVASAATTSNGNDRNSELSSVTGFKTSKEATHWHSTRKLSALGSKPSPVDVRSEVKIRRRNQQRMAEMVSYAASLTNAVGKVLEPETIVTAKAAESYSSPKPRKDERTKPNRLHHELNEWKFRDAQRRVEGRQDAELDKASAAWGFAFDKFQREQDMLRRYTSLIDYIGKLSPLQMKLVGPDALLYACSILGGQLSKDDGPLKPIGKAAGCLALSVRNGC